MIELLVVVGVIAVLTSLAIPAFQAIRGGTDFTGAVYDIAGVFDQARAYATANNTYVLAGVIEVNGVQSTAATPQTAGTGRVAMAVVASKTGARPYDIYNLTNWTNIYNTGLVTLTPNGGGGLVSVIKLATFQGVHLVDLQSSGSILGNLARPTVAAAYNLSNSTTSQAGATVFGWPLGVQLSAPPQYTFQKVVEFDPRGSARIINSTNLNAIPHFIELGIQPAYGTAVPATPSNQNPGQIAAIQIDGMSGAVRTYRP